MIRSNTPLLDQQNIGPTIAARLKTIGIHTIGDLRTVGAATAYKKLKEAYPKVTLPVCYYLYSLQGAVDGMHWNALECFAKRSKNKATK